MHTNSISAGLPLLIIVEGENDVCFLQALSAILHRHDPELPDLCHLVAQRHAVFLPTGGSNLNEWMLRVECLNLRAFHLFDREQEPETAERRKVIDAINRRPGQHATLTRKRAIENYLHPVAVLEATIVELRFDDDDDVAGLLAHQMMLRSGESCWSRLPCKRQKRLHDKAKKALNVKAAQRMTPSLLAERDPDGEFIGWLQTIRKMTGI